MVVVHISQTVCGDVHLAEGGDGDTGMLGVLQIAMSCRGGNDKQQLVRPVHVVCGKQHVGGENHAPAAVDIHRCDKDGDSSWEMKSQ